MGRILPFVFLTALLLFSGCLGENIKKTEMTLETKVAESTGSLEASEVKLPELQRMISDGEEFVLLDVRTEEEYSSGYIPGAINIHYTDLEARIGELNLSPDAKIVMYCEAGVRSKKGAHALTQAGFTNIVDVTDGMVGWRRLGGEIVHPSFEPDIDEIVEYEEALEVVNSIPEHSSISSASMFLEGPGMYKVVFLGTKSDYEAGHIPSSIRIDSVNDLIDPNSSLRNKALNKEDFESLLSRLGIGTQDNLLVYDNQADNKYAARFFWIAKLYGHEGISILEDISSLDLESGAFIMSTEPSSYFVSNSDEGILANIEYVEKNLNNPYSVLVDATTKEEYDNDGHIPGAVLVEVEETLNPDGTFKDNNELLSLFHSRGVTEDKEVITYCHSGNRASVIWFELTQLLGYPNVRLYDGSLEEWNSLGKPLEWVEPKETTPSTKAETVFGMPKKLSDFSFEELIVVTDMNEGENIFLPIRGAIKVGDGLIYLTGGFIDACAGMYSFEFNVYRETVDGFVYEGRGVYVNTEAPGLYPGMDVSERIHDNSDAVDNLSLNVMKWNIGQGVVLSVSG